MTHRRAALAGLILAAGFAAPAFAAPVIDPACLQGVAWEVDPTSGPIQINGCRPASQIPAPDAQGWIEYDRGQVNGSDGGFLRAKLVSVGANGAVTFQVQDNGGGSGTFGLEVTGVPAANGVLAPASVKIKLLGGS